MHVCENSILNMTEALYDSHNFGHDILIHVHVQVIYLVLNQKKKEKKKNLYCINVVAISEQKAYIEYTYNYCLNSFAK